LLLDLTRLCPREKIQSPQMQRKEIFYSKLHFDSAGGFFFYHIGLSRWQISSRQWREQSPTSYLFWTKLNVPFLYRDLGKSVCLTRSCLFSFFTSHWCASFLQFYCIHYKMVCLNWLLLKITTVLKQWLKFDQHDDEINPEP
jgi:hypothetical protein